MVSKIPLVGKILTQKNEIILESNVFITRKVIGFIMNTDIIIPSPCWFIMSVVQEVHEVQERKQKFQEREVY